MGLDRSRLGRRGFACRGGNRGVGVGVEGGESREKHLWIEEECGKKLI